MKQDDSRAKTSRRKEYGGLYSTLSLRIVARLFLLLAALACGTAAHAAPPNIVFILIDDLGWADLGCYGNAFNETPNIDRLASEGLRFTDAYAACPVCSPSRASILSGQYPARLGLTDFITGHWRPYAPLRVPTNRTQYLPLEIVTLAEALQPAGYTTGAFGKWHLGGREYFPDKQGFDESIVTTGWGHFGNKSLPDQQWTKEDYLAEKLTDHAIDFMTRHKEQPFFLYLSHFAVHIPLEAREKLIAKYEAKPKPATGINHPIYAAMLEHVDDSVGRLLDSLDALGIADNTLVVFFSDNGGLHQRYDGKDGIVSTNAPLRDEKGSLYEGGIRVPLIVKWPGKVQPGTTSATPVTSTDFYPTFLAVSSASSPDQPQDGVSLLPLITEAKGDGDRPIFWHYPHYHHSTPASVVRKGDWKLIDFYEEGLGPELYNLAKDLSETHNLAATQPEKLAELTALLNTWRAEVHAEAPVPNPDHDPARAAEWGKHP